jgi:hypothetical protein
VLSCPFYGAGFLAPESRSEQIELTLDGSLAHRLTRRANALLLLLEEDEMSCETVAEVLPGDDTIRTWHWLYLVSCPSITG